MSKSQSKTPAAKRFGGGRSAWLGWLRRQEGNAGDGLFRSVTALFALSAVLLLVGMTLELWWASSESIEEFGIGFLWSTDWDPVKELYGALPFIFGTLVSSLIALIIAVPVALGVAIFRCSRAPSGGCPCSRARPGAWECCAAASCSPS